MAVPAYPIVPEVSGYAWTRSDLEWQKFTLDHNGLPAIRTVLADATIDLSGSTFEVQCYTNGIYALGTNPVPDTEGIVVCQAAAAPADANQVVRVTGGQNGADALVALNAWGMDTRSLLYGFNGTTWDRLRESAAANTLAFAYGLMTQPARYMATPPALTDTFASPLLLDSVGKLRTVEDGFYVVATNAIPASTGLIFHSVAAAPAITDQVIRTTAGKNDADGLVAANVWGIDTRSLAYGFNGATWDRLRTDPQANLQVTLHDADGTAVDLLALGTDSIANNLPELVTASFGYGFNGSTWERTRTATALTDLTLAGTLGSFHNAETGVPFSLMMGYDNTAGANAYRAVAVSALGAFKVDTDGYYVAVTNPIPDTEGLTVCQNAAAPAITDYIIRPTGGVATATVTSANWHGIDTRSKLYAQSGANEQELDATLVAVGSYGLPVGVFDAAGNRMPTMDAAARAGYHYITNGTLTAAVTTQTATSNMDGENTLETSALLHARLDGNYAYTLSEVTYTGAMDAQYKLGVCSEIVDFDTTGATDFTGAMGILAASSAGAKPVQSDTGGRLYSVIGDSTNTVTVIQQDSAFGTTSWGFPMFGKYQATPTTYNDNDACPILLDANGRVVLSSDIQIGAVELKDAAADTRASIIAPNTAAVAYYLATMPARYMATPPALTDTYTSPLLLDSVGKLKVVNDGYYVVATNALPASSGVVVCANAAVPAVTDQTTRVTGGTAAGLVSGVAIANYSGMDVRSLCGGINAATVRPFDACAVSAAVTYGISAGIFDASGNRMPSIDVNSRAGFMKLTDGALEADIVANSGVSQPTNFVGIAGEVVDFDTTGGTDFTAAIGILAATSSGAKYVRADTGGNIYAVAFDGTNSPTFVQMNSAYGTTIFGYPVMGKYQVTPTAYDDGDAVPLLCDANGRLVSTIELNDYTDDSNEFTVATSKGLAIMGLATSDAVDAGDIGALAMSINRSLKVDIAEQSLTAVKISATAAANSASNPIYVNDVGGSGITANPFVANTNVAVATVPNDHDLNTTLGKNASKILICNTHATGTLQIDSSYNGIAFVGTDITIGPGETIELDDDSIDTLRVDADTSGTTYWVRAW